MQRETGEALRKAIKQEVAASIALRPVPESKAAVVNIDNERLARSVAEIGKALDQTAVIDAIKSVGRDMLASTANKVQPKVEFKPTIDVNSPIYPKIEVDGSVVNFDNAVIVQALAAIGEALDQGPVIAAIEAVGKDMRENTAAIKEMTAAYKLDRSVEYNAEGRVKTVKVGR